MTVAYTQAEIDTLKAAIVSGVLTVSYDGPPRRSVTYQSLDAMRATLAQMARTLDTPTSYRLGKTSKGF
jgi:hypothetical protein